MKQRDFEKQLRQIVPGLNLINYGRRIIKNRLTTTEVYVHETPGICNLMMGPNCLQKMLDFYKEHNNASK